MEFKLIAKVDESLVFEVGEGLWVTVSYREGQDGEPVKSKVHVDIPWTNPLERFAWSYTKCNSDPKEDKCLELIKENKDMVLERLNQYQELYKEHPEMKEENVQMSEEALEGLKDGERVSLG